MCIKDMKLCSGLQLTQHQKLQKINIIFNTLNKGLNPHESSITVIYYIVLLPHQNKVSFLPKRIK